MNSSDRQCLEFMDRYFCRDWLTSQDNPANKVPKTPWNKEHPLIGGLPITNSYIGCVSCLKTSLRQEAAVQQLHSEVQVQLLGRGRQKRFVAERRHFNEDPGNTALQGSKRHTHKTMYGTVDFAGA